MFQHPDDTAIRQLLERVRRIAVVVDLVDVFRRSEMLAGVIDDALEARAGAPWLQLGCIDHDGAARAQAAGMTVVMDRCLMVDHARLVGRGRIRT